MTDQANPIPLPSNTGVVGSRKIRLNRTISSSAHSRPQPSKDEGDITDFAENETRSTIVDSVFSNFVAKKMEEIAKERKQDTSDAKSKDKKHKHKKSDKEKYKKHKHKNKHDKDLLCKDGKDSKEKDVSEKNQKEEDSDESSVEKADGFFAKESFLEPGKKENINNSDIDSDSNQNKSKKHKKHKKKHKHKHKHEKDKSKRDSSKLLSFHDDVQPDIDCDTNSGNANQTEVNTKTSDIFKEKTSPKNIFADRLEKAIESKLSSLKENLTKKHKALEDLSKELKIPEKKIKMMTEITLNEKYKIIQDKEKKTSLCKSTPEDGSATKSQNSTTTPKNSSALSEHIMKKQVSLEDREDGNKTITAENLSCYNPKRDESAKEERDEDGFLAMKPKKDREEEQYAKSSGVDHNKSSSLSQIGLSKKPLGMKLGLKLSVNSMSLITSGVKTENDPKKRNREEGEITDSQEGTVTGTSSSSLYSDSSTDGEIKEDLKSKKKKGGTTKERKKSSKDKSQRRSRSRSPRRHQRSRSRSYDEERGVWTSRSRRKRSRSRSRSRDRRRRSRERDDYHRKRSRSYERQNYSDRNFYYNDRYKRRSRSRERRKSPQDLRLKIDKAKLREIAMKNAYAMLGGDEEVAKNLKPDQIAAIKAGGKSVEELTNFCKKIAEKDPQGNSSSDEDSRPRVPLSDDEEAPFIHHPFKVNPNAANIALNIRNARQLPVTSFADRAAKAGELRIQFPVSSGSQHKNKEDEWVPVEKTSTAPTKPIVTATNTVQTAKPLPKPGVIIPPPPAPPTPDMGGGVSIPTATQDSNNDDKKEKNDEVFPEQVKVNISDVVSERLSALRKLQSNPNDVEAMGTMYKSQQAMKTWAENQQEPGQFTGSTGVKILSVKELQGPGGHATWIKKDMFHRAAPVRGGIGRLLLQKMGWKEGTGLGKEESGSVEPLNLEIKCDRKGLVTADEAPAFPPPNKGKGPKAPVVRDLSGKHPVSALMELCKKRRWDPPAFELVFECGPPHKKNFVFKATVNNTDYQPTIASPNKKHAKAQAATVVLQKFGLVPNEEVV